MYNVLVCDDEKDIVSALRIYLTTEGYQDACDGWNHCDGKAAGTQQCAGDHADGKK